VISGELVHHVELRWLFRVSSTLASYAPFIATLVAACTGAVKFFESVYLVLITKKRKVGYLRGHYVYAIEGTEIVPVIHKNFLRGKLNQSTTKYKELFADVSLDKDMFFSYRYDLTHSLQYNLTAASHLAVLNRGKQDSSTAAGAAAGAVPASLSAQSLSGTGATSSSATTAAAAAGPAPPRPAHTRTPSSQSIASIAVSDASSQGDKATPLPVAAGLPRARLSPRYARASFYQLPALTVT